MIAHQRRAPFKEPQNETRLPGSVPLSGHFRWLLDNELLKAKKSIYRKSYDYCLYVQVHFVKDWWRDVASSGKAEEVSCRYVAWRCSNSCKCPKWSPRIEAARGSTKGSCSWWKYAVSWCPSPSEVLSWENQSDWRWLIYLNGQAVFRLKISYYLEDAVLPLLGTGYMV